MDHNRFCSTLRLSVGLADGSLAFLSILALVSSTKRAFLAVGFSSSVRPFSLACSTCSLLVLPRRFFTSAGLAFSGVLNGNFLLALQGEAEISDLTNASIASNLLGDRKLFLSTLNGDCGLILRGDRAPF